MMASPLFNPQLIDQPSNLPQGFKIRPLEITDYDKGFLLALSMLTVVGDISKQEFVNRYSYLKAHAHEYFTIVIEDLNKKTIAGAGTIFVERKFIRNLGLVGHIEDIVTHENYRGSQFGRFIIDALKSIGKNVGCYKIILDCSEKNVPFYVKCGFERKEVEMVLYLNNAKQSKL